MASSREQIAERLAAVGYVADRELPVALQLMEMLSRPLLLEGEAGVGKTEVAKALAAVHGTKLIRLQCYEGLDQSTALYEWNYQRQLLAIRAREAVGGDADEVERDIFSERFLLERPLLAAIRRGAVERAMLVTHHGRELLRLAATRLDLWKFWRRAPRIDALALTAAGPDA